MRRFASRGDSTTSKPPTVTRPPLGGMNPVIIRMVVDLPAPLGPRKPSTSPRSTLNETPSTARFAPNVFTRFSILIIGLELMKGRHYRPNRTRKKIMRFSISSLLLISSLTGLLALPGAAMAQQYPAKPIRIVVPFAPGGGSDFIARFIAQRLTTGLGQQVIVENKPGAGGMLGIEQGVKSPADGYTLTLIASSYTVNPSIYKFSFDPVNDITPIIQLSQGPLLIVVNPKVPVKTTQDLIKLAKAKPGQVNFASSGQGSVIHMATELFQSMAGVKM